MGSAIGPVFDYLVANLPGALQAVDPDVVVADGWVTDIADHLVIIGRRDPTDSEAASGRQVYELLGGAELQLDETFTIPMVIDCWAGGLDTSVARQAALTLLDAFVAFIRADMTLGGALFFWAELSEIRVGQTRDDLEAMQGRRAIVSFSLVCKNRYTP